MNNNDAAMTKVHIVGTHGVPARYGGFETLADHLAQNFQGRYDLTIYCNAHKYPEKIPTYFGAKLRYVPLDASGLQGIFYDFYTYILALAKADVILYLSPVGSGFITPLKYFAGKKVIVNHGGLNEWEREKLSTLEKYWAKFNHFVAARCADVNIADNRIYQKSLKTTFNTESTVIRYGGDHARKIPVETPAYLHKYPFVKEPYAVSVSRAQVDNNLHILLEAFANFSNFKLVLISNWDVSDYGVKLKARYSNNPNIILLDAIYDIEELDYLRGNAYVYIHSHSRCGTAPSLVEAMSLHAAIIAYDVPVNRETTDNQAHYFTTTDELTTLLSGLSLSDIERNSDAMYAIASSFYTWNKVSQEYQVLIGDLCK